MAIPLDLESVLSSAVGGHRAPGAQAALLVGGETVSACVGPGVTAQTRFEIGSVTKVLVAAAVTEHVVAGRIGLDDPVTRWIPRFDPVDRRITVGQLLLHTSGIDAADDLSDTGDDEGAVARYVEEHLAGVDNLLPPGERWSYCNAGYIVAGRLLEVIEDRVFDDVLADRFRAAGMEATTTRPVAPAGLPIAQGHRLDPATGAVEPFDGSLPRSTGPAGATVLTTAADLVQLGRGFVEGTWPARPVQEAMLASTVTIRDGRQALGWSLAPARTTVMTHGGTSAAFTAVLTVVPALDASLAVVANGPGAAGIALAISAALGLSPPAPPPTHPALPVELLRRHTGRYRRRGVTQTIAIDGEGRLTATAEFDHSIVGPFLPPPTTVLDPIDDSCFAGQAPWDGMPQRYDFFTPDEDGRSTGLFTARVHLRR